MQVAFKVILDDDWVLFHRGGPEPGPDFFGRVPSEGLVLIEAPSAAAGAAAYRRPVAASALMERLESSHLLVRRADLPPGEIADISPVDLALGLIAHGLPCHFIPAVPAAEKTVPEPPDPATSFRRGRELGRRLAFHAPLRRPGAPGISLHFIACCTIAVAGVVTGRFLLLALPPLFLVLSLLTGPRRDAGLRGLFDLPFGCGQIMGALARASSAGGGRLDDGDEAMSGCFPELVRGLWCDHASLLLATGLLAALS